MRGEQVQVKKAAEKAAEKVAGKEKAKVEQTVGQATTLGPLKGALGVSNSTAEGMYGQAYRLYNTGRYDDAIHLFRLLIMLNATEPKYTLGMAACYHMKKEYNEALRLYAIYTIVDPESPIPHYHSSDCYLHTNDKPSAYLALQMAVKRAEGKPEFATLLQRAQLGLDGLTKELEKFRKK